MSTSVGPQLKQFVRDRAEHRCEYCRVSSRDYSSPFHVDHVRPRQHGGTSSAENLALACLHCNSHKGPNLSGVDPVDDSVHLLFHPREQRWAEHFTWDGPLIIGQTAVGRATICVLSLNASDAVSVRRSLIEQGNFPPVER